MIICHLMEKEYNQTSGDKQIPQYEMMMAMLSI